MPGADQIAAIPLFAGLAEAERQEVAAGLRAVRFADGEALMRQGQPPDGAYFLLSGKVRVLTKLPGGGETPIAEAGPGSLIGEMALIRAGPRGATVRANGAVEALFADRRYFRAALAQLRPAAIQVSRNLAVLLTQRLQQLYGRIREHVETEPKGTYFRPLPAPAGEAAQAFEVRPFLPILPCLAGFDATDCDRLLACGAVRTLPRGASLTGDPAAAGIVVRGAVLAGLAGERGLHQVAVIGPGRFCRIDASLLPGADAPAHFVQETATMLLIPAAAFQALFGGSDEIAQRLLNAINEHQAAMLQRVGNHLTRLVGLSRLHRQADVPAVAL